MTNAHVVSGAQKVTVKFSNGKTANATVLGANTSQDIAVVKAQGVSGLTPATLGDSSKVAVGDSVLAIGSPLGLDGSVTSGIVSALNRTIEESSEDSQSQGQGGFGQQQQQQATTSIKNALQTDAAINPGNSGGPLLSGRGNVLGINSQIKSTSGGGEGVGFAIPVDTVRRSLRDLRAHGKVEYGYLGVTSQPLYPQLARRLGLPVDTGALVVDVQDGSPADDAGIEKGSDTIDFQGQRGIPSKGDVIVGVAGRRLTRRDDLADLVGARDAGDKVSLDVLRGGKRRTVEVTLGKRPEEPPKSN
jgi:S1-C subfamily serine protease